jgi:hypothetical protein
MSPEQVPAELVERAARAVADELPACAMCGENGPARCVYCKDDAEKYARVILAAVLPLAQAAAFDDAARIVHAERRFQAELAERRNLGAEYTEQRMGVIEATIEGFAVRLREGSPS